jgi:hypothetical protein
MNKGISLIVLVITIIVIIILAGSIILTIVNNNLIKQAKEATFASSLSEYSSELSMYIGNQSIETTGDFSLDNLNALTPDSVKAIIKRMKTGDAEKYIISKGKLVYIGSNQDEINWAKTVNTSLDLPYVKSGLLLWYDGIYNGGLGIHNDGTSPNKNIWKDLSGNNNDGQLINFNHTSNGWLENGLKFTTLTDFVKMVAINTPYRTVEVVFAKNENIVDEKPIVCNYESGGIGLTIYYNKFRNPTYIAGTGYTNLQEGSVIEKDKLYYSSVAYDGTYIKDYVQGVNWATVNISGIIGIPGAGSIYVLNGNPAGTDTVYSLSKETIYSVRIYDRALTLEEITQNYAIDKARFNLL